MRNTPVQGSELEAFSSGEFRQIVVGYFMALRRIGFERGQIIRDEFDGVLGQEILQKPPRIRHGGAKSFGLRAYAQKSQLGEWARSQFFALKPGIGLWVIGVISPDGGNQRINIQKVFQGKSSNAARTCSLVMLRPLEATA